MDVKIKGNKIQVDNKFVFIQGMNLFLDEFRLEKDPRRIYRPSMANDELITRIIPQLKDAHINTVRLWPTIVNGEYVLNISDTGIETLKNAGFWFIINLPANWNLKPTYPEIKKYLQRYSANIYPNILCYCIGNEVYHGLIMPHQYIDGINQLTHKFGHRPTLITNANLNFPWYNRSDIIGADFFTYRYSISRDGVDDVGAVAQMYFEDAAKIYRWFPKMIFKIYPFIVRYMKRKALTANFDPKYFRKNLLKVLKIAQKVEKPYLICEYGYTEHPNHIPIIINQMPIREMVGHIWYNWVNFDPNMDGIVENTELFETFKNYYGRLKKIKENQLKKM